MPGLFALVDMDAFYVSAEAVFNPRLRGKPVCVLSNGDGNVVARSREAKALGIAMGQPAFQLRDLVRSNGLRLLSSSYALYGDMSARAHDPARVCAGLRELLDRRGLPAQAPACRRHGLGSPDARARPAVVRHPLPRRVRSTKTLAKLANRLAKRGNGDGVVDLGDPATHDAALAATPVEDVRGIGARWAARLNDLGIATALALRDAPALQIRQHFGVVVERTQRELQGHSCLAIEDVAPSRKQVVSSRTFGTPVTDESTMVAAVAHHVTRACERVRAQGLAAAMQVFFHTSPFRQGPQ
jgi:DNA polymerase V